MRPLFPQLLLIPVKGHEKHLHGLWREELSIPPVSSPQAIQVSRLLSLPVLLGRSGPDRGIPNAHLPSTVSTETKALALMRDTSPDPILAARPYAT